MNAWWHAALNQVRSGVASGSSISITRRLGSTNDQMDIFVNCLACNIILEQYITS